MSLALKAVSGPIKDEVYPLKNPMTIGRAGADISLNEPKVSTLHARIHQAQNGEWVLKDNNSKNGVRQNGEKVDTVILDPGARFLVADIEFQVIIYEAPGDMELPKAPPAKPEKKQKTWHQILGQLIEGHMTNLSDEALAVQPMHPAIVLDFLRGIQVSARWVLGYGPRKAGSSSLDLPIWEPGAPDTCFELTPEKDGIYFSTKHKDVVRLNGESVDRRVLHVGDTIQINETVIEVDFTE